VNYFTEKIITDIQSTYTVRFQTLNTLLKTALFMQVFKQKKGRSPV